MSTCLWFRMVVGLAPRAIASQQYPLRSLNYHYNRSSSRLLPPLLPFSSTNKEKEKHRSLLHVLPDQAMESNKEEIIFEFPGIFRIHKDGRAERFIECGFAPPSVNDPSTGVSSKDVVIDSQIGLSARLYLPKQTTQQNNRIPLLIYIHGGAFCLESAFSPSYHSYLNSLVAQANVVAVSVEYRKAPEHPLPIAYDDSWAALQWVISQSNEQQDEWLKKYADLDRVYVAGDSAGANIAHNVVMRAGLNGRRISGVVLFHPLFCGVEPVGSEVTSLNHLRAGKLWSAICPGTTGADDPRYNPAKDPNLPRLGCERMLVCVAEEDQLRDRGWFYYEELKKIGWKGVVEFMEAKGENHVFHLFNPACDNANELMKRVVLFLNTST